MRDPPKKVNAAQEVQNWVQKLAAPTRLCWVNGKNHQLCSNTFNHKNPKEKNQRRSDPNPKRETATANKTMTT